MQKLLAIEWLKIKSYRTFWILGLLFLALLIFWNYAISSGMLQLGDKQGGINILSRAYSFPEVWDNIGFWIKVFSGLIAIMIIIITTNEYQFRTNRQNVIDGWSRLQFFHAKWLLVLMLSVIVTLFALLMGTVFGLATGKSFAGFQYHLYSIGYVFLLSMNYSGFALLLSLLIRRSGIAIIIFLLYLYVVEILLQGIINHYTSSHIGDFLPTQSSAELLTFPLFSALKKVANVGSDIPSWAFVLASVAWIVIYYFIGRRKLLRSDW